MSGSVTLFVVILLSPRTNAWRVRFGPSLGERLRQCFGAREAFEEICVRIELWDENTHYKR